MKRGGTMLLIRKFQLFVPCHRCGRTRSGGNGASNRRKKSVIPSYAPGSPKAGALPSVSAYTDC